MVDECDLEISSRLKTILPVTSLVEQRNEFESRLSQYFDA